MPRISTILVLLVLCLSLTACSSDNGNDSNETPEATQNQTSSSTQPAPIQTQSSDGASATESADKVLVGTMVPTIDPATLPTVPANLDADNDGFYTLDEWILALELAYADFHWPSAYTMSLEAMVDRGMKSWGPNDTFEARGEYTIIGTNNQCAWVLNWLDAYQAGDDTQMSLSLTELRRLFTIVPLLDQSTIDYFNEAYDLAELGDGSRMQQMSQQCNPDLFNNAAASSTPAAANVWAVTRHRT